jgi:Zn-dependent metalloprotease
MNTLPQPVCGVIPPHMLKRVANDITLEASEHARATLEHMHALSTGRAPTLLAQQPDGPPPNDERRRVYDARHRFELPGKLVIWDGRGEGAPSVRDVEAVEAWRGSGITYDFFRRVFGRRSIDGRDMRLDASVHYGTGFENAMWNGRQMVYGDGDGKLFGRFTASVDVIAHELTHGITQHSAALGYSGQTGALNEHISDVFGILVRQYSLLQTAEESDWRIGAALFGPAASGCAVRSFAHPGHAYDHPLLGRDPQPAHMSGYVETDEDHGGVHVNSGILNHAFYRAATEIGGYAWQVLGPVWYDVLTTGLVADAGFEDFARATIETAGEMYGLGSDVQWALGDAWESVGVLTNGGAPWRHGLASRAACQRFDTWRRHHPHNEERKIA